MTALQFLIALVVIVVIVVALLDSIFEWVAIKNWRDELKAQRDCERDL